MDHLASCYSLCLLAALGLLLGALPVYAQDAPPTAEEDEEKTYGTGIGLEVLLTNSGFALGGYYQREVGEVTSLVIEANLGAGKNEREYKYYSRFGNGFVPNKRNYLLLLPIHLGAQQRLFAEVIEDNFRPYVHFTAGPTLGWVYPYFNDRDGNERYDEDIDRRYDIFSAFPKGKARLGVGGMIAVGANFGLSRKVTQGIRFGYAFHYFFDGIQLLEPDITEAQQRFGTPVISITFGRLY
ncbi:MAG TPA: hypothetical protein VKP65_21865 [Rhodothermales bacterium]|nr:hypothetical protein [Rhodothermales bacterium]